MACLESAIFSIHLEDDHNEKNICQEGGGRRSRRRHARLLRNERRRLRLQETSTAAIQETSTTATINPLINSTGEAIDIAIDFLNPIDSDSNQKHLIEKSKEYLKNIKGYLKNIKEQFPNFKKYLENIKQQFPNFEKYKSSKSFSHIDFLKNFYKYFFIHEYYILKNIFPTTSGDCKPLIHEDQKKKLFDKDTLMKPIEKFRSLFNSSQMSKVSSVFDIDFVKSQYETKYQPLYDKTISSKVLVGKNMSEATAVPKDSKKKYPVLYDDSISSTVVSEVVDNILHTEAHVRKAFEKSRSIREDFKNLDQHLRSHSHESATAAIKKSVELVQEMEFEFLTILDNLVLEKKIVTKKTNFFKRKHKKYKKSRLSLFTKKSSNYKIHYKNLYDEIIKLKSD